MDFSPMKVDYVRAVRSGRAFATLRGVSIDYNRFGLPVMTVGGNGCVFRISICGKPFGLKCHTVAHPRTQAIVDFFAAHPSSLLPAMQYLPRELEVSNLLVGTVRCDVLLIEWVEGVSLGFELRRLLAAGNEQGIECLAHLFDRMALQLLSERWAHGDLKPDNIIVAPDRLWLVDCDAVWDSQLEPCVSLGTEGFRHPRRSLSRQGKHIDHYPLVLLSLLLHSAALDMNLFEPHEWLEGRLFDPLQTDDCRCSHFNRLVDMLRLKHDKQLLMLVDALGSKSVAIEGIENIFGSLTENR